MRAVCEHSAGNSNGACVISEVSSGRSNANCRNATRMKDQRSRTKQRTIVLIDRRRSRPREVVSGA